MIHGTWEPAPATRWEDGFLSGNGRHGAIVYGGPQDERTVVTHHSLVRPNGSENARPPRLAEELEHLKDSLLAGDASAAERFGTGYPLWWVQPFHPAFQVRVRRESDASGYRRELDFATGVVSAKSGDWHSRAFVSRADDVIVQYVTGTPLSLDLTLDHRLPGAPAQLAVSRETLLTPRDVQLTLTIGYPGSCRAYTGITYARVDGGAITSAGDGVRIVGARGLLLLTRVARHRHDLDLVARAASLRSLLTGPPRCTGTAEVYAGLLARHEEPHRAAYERVGLCLSGDEAERKLPGSELVLRPRSTALLERLFAAGRYHLLSASGMLPPRLVGLWSGDWDTAWSGAFTTNANLNLQISSAATAGLPEVAEAHATFVQGQLADWRANARTLFGTRGVVAPAHTDGESGHNRHFQRAYPHHLWTAGADWLLQPLVEHAETTGAADPRLIGALVEVALFYQDFLTRTGPDGRIVIVPSYSPENRPATGSWGAVNATMDIAAARHALTTAAAYAPGHPATDSWRALAERLPAYRINDDGALAEWAWPGLEDSYDHRHISHLYPVWPLDEINPYDTPELAAAAHRALELRGAENDSAHGYLHTALVAARLRDAGRVTAALDAVLAGDFFHDSLMSAHYPQRNVYNADAAHTLPAVLVEMLVQSSPGRLVLLPALSAAYRKGQLTGVRTRFGCSLDLSWDADDARAVLRPSRAARVELRHGAGWTLAGPHPPHTSAGPCGVLLDLVAGEDRVLTLRRR